jgi:ABC-2 type transport system ATP-binding protein
MREAVRVEHLTKKFNDFTAVDDVTFSVERGEIFGFLGPNGAGKTTTIKMLTGLHAPTSGKGWVAGVDVTEHSREIKQRIGYMSQQFSLYADLTVSENIELYGGLYEVAAQQLTARRSWVLDMAGLSDRTNALTGQLPLGWKQRLALGCAVLHEPEILFLDEPTSGVDPIARRRFWDLIDGMSERGTTVLVSTHYMEEAEFCHRLALMNRGKLIAVDSPTSLRARLQAPILALTTDNPARAVEIISGTAGTSDVSLFGRKVHVVVDSEAEARDQLPRLLESHGVPCHDVRRVPPALEDVFVRLVREQGGAVAG